MFCLQCGKEMEDDAKFCPFCGAMTGEGAPETLQEPAADAEEFAPQASVEAGTPEGGRKRKGILSLAVMGVAAAAAVALVITGVGALFSSPKTQVGKAVGKTLSEYGKVADQLGALDVARMAKDGSVTLVLGGTLTGGEGLSSLEGLGGQLQMDYDQKGKKMDLELAAHLDGEDLISVQALVNGGKVTVGSKELTDGKAYGLNTETLGADLVKLDVDYDEDLIDLKKFGFNIFDLIEKLSPTDAQRKEIEGKLKEAGKALGKAIEVEKEGKETVEVNDKDVKATLYTVTIPEDAMKDYVDAYIDAMEVVDPRDTTKEVLEAMGFGRETINEVVSEMDDVDYSELGRQLKQGIKALGDLELKIYVSDGRVCLVQYDEKFQGSRLQVELALGGGKNYVDDLSLNVAEDKQDIFTLTSTGNHACKGNEFTDETTLRIYNNWSGESRVTSEMSYKPKASKDNFSWEIGVNGVGSVEMEGQLKTGKNSMELHLDDLSVRGAGSKLFSMELDYQLGSCKGMKVSHSSPTMLSEMDLEDLMDLYEDIEDAGEDLMYDLMTGKLGDMLYYMF